ncbi:MAG: hypothetical protein H6710_18315 [Myxococcales bacterium]|nr:hypothetical protein [Myxococcales bacterium]MCB9701245.1 hypothetical protein [Myxococcales bacterium]
MRAGLVALLSIVLLAGCRSGPGPAAAAPSASSGEAEGDGPGPEPGPEVEAEAPTLVGTAVPPGDPPANAQRCSIRDDNGPLEGGASTSSGCDADAICVCTAQAGYSCAGACVRDGAWVLAPGS